MPVIYFKRIIQPGNGSRRSSSPLYPLVSVYEALLYCSSIEIMKRPTPIPLPSQVDEAVILHPILASEYTTSTHPSQHHIRTSCVYEPATDPPLPSLALVSTFPEWDVILVHPSPDGNHVVVADVLRGVHALLTRVLGPTCSKLRAAKLRKLDEHGDTWEVLVTSP